MSQTRTEQASILEGRAAQRLAQGDHGPDTQQMLLHVAAMQGRNLEEAEQQLDASGMEEN